MSIYIPNLIVLASRLPELLDRATRRHEYLFVASCAVIAWLTLELLTPVGPLWGEQSPADPQRYAITCGTLLVVGLIIATAFITKDRRYTKEAWLVSLTAYCLLLGTTAGFEYAATCGIFMAVASAAVYLIVMKFIEIAFHAATE